MRHGKLNWITFSLGLALLPLSNGVASAQSTSIQGTYQAVLVHELEGFHQYATITLRTVNSGSGTLKISANVRVFFGEQNSSEFLVYDYADVPMNIITRQISMGDSSNDLSFIGYLKDGEISGDWFSSAVGRVGSFKALKGQVPPVPEDSVLVHSLTGHYRGRLRNTNSASNLPERVTVSLVTTQDNTSSKPEMHISGNLRFYLGDFGSNEYVETAFEEVQFNFYNRYLTLRTKDYGITIKGTMTQEGTFSGEVFADGLGKVGNLELAGE